MDEKAGEIRKRPLDVGGKLDRVYNEPVRFSGELIYKNETRQFCVLLVTCKTQVLILFNYSTNQPINDSCH
jgi:tRNA uridine 5-carbamoylmethylation protein Kti12